VTILKKPLYFGQINNHLPLGQRKKSPRQRPLFAQSWPVLLIGFLCLAMPALADMRDTNKVRAGTPPYDVLKQVITSNREVLKGLKAPGDGVAPLLTWLTDTDPRLQSSTILQNPFGRVCMVTNLGAQIEASPGEVDYGVNRLHSPVLLITLGTDSWTVLAALDQPAANVASAKASLERLAPVLNQVEKKKDPTEWRIRRVEAAVDHQVQVALKRYEDRVKSGRLVVVGSMMDFDGEYRRGKNRLLLININGETEPEALRQLLLTRGLAPALADPALGRYQPPAKASPSDNAPIPRPPAQPPKK